MGDADEGGLELHLTLKYNCHKVSKKYIFASAVEININSPPDYFFSIMFLLLIVVLFFAVMKDVVMPELISGTLAAEIGILEVTKL